MAKLTVKLSYSCSKRWGLNHWALQCMIHSIYTLCVCIYILYTHIYEYLYVCIYVLCQICKRVSLSYAWIIIIIFTNITCLLPNVNSAEAEFILLHCIRKGYMNIFSQYFFFSTISGATFCTPLILEFFFYTFYVIALCIYFMQVYYIYKLLMPKYILIY